ncbi:DoxX family protein [Undibacterium sp. Ren11W]|uniref:DoxX family protein n=1 Tax=Undibacterium sp. Ren11W TaxID=3413045 RepID=UPI003BF0B4B9
MTAGPAKLETNLEAKSETKSETKLANKFATKPRYTSIEYGVTVLRLSLGVMWIAHAMLKLLVFALPGTAEFFVSIGFPGFLAYPVFAAELGGGLALLFGVYARQVALALMPVMAVAASVHFANGWVHTSQNGGWEYPVFLLMASLSLWLMGDGAYAWCRSRRFSPNF